jgi:hypothetical protein
MYNAKSQVANKLAEIQNVNVAASYKKGMESIPCIIYREAGNTQIYPGNERLIKVVYVVDIYHTVSTSSLTDSVNGKMSELGFARDFCNDLDDPAGYRHKTMRFKGVIDTKTELVYQ